MANVWASVEGKVKKLTEQAVGFETEKADAGTLLWLPKSQIKGVDGEMVDEDEIGTKLEEGAEITEVLVPEWLAKDKGLEYDEE